VTRFLPVPVAWAASGLVHGGLFLAVVAAGVSTRAFDPPPARPLRSLDVTVVTTKAIPEPAPVPPPASPPLSTPTTARVESKPAPAKHVVPVAPHEPTQAPSPKDAMDDAPLDLTATTLTSDHGAFAVAPGNGGAVFGGTREGGGARTAAAAAKGAPVAATPTLALVAKEDLSRLPAPPSLSDALLSHYPAAARARGDSGDAVLSLIVRSDGRIEDIRVRTASSPEFGRACADTLRGSRWSPPLDRNAAPVSTRVGYTCRFDVR
jgi:TonB family protein